MNPKTDWKSSSLLNQFERAVIGFDLRKAESVTQLFLTSYNDKVRFEDFMETNERLLSPINIFLTDPTGIPEVNLPSNAEVIAFDLPLDYLLYQSHGNVSIAPKISFNVLSRDWNFMGFDIVDPFTQLSALSGEMVLPSDVSLLSSDSLFNRNGNGLIDDPDAALKAAVIFDALIPEHAPFVPCGIWLKYRKSSLNTVRLD